MARYLITLGRSTYDHHHDYPRLAVDQELQAMVDLFTNRFGYQHLPALSTAEVDPAKLLSIRNWFLEKHCGVPLRTPEDLVVIYYSGHGDLLKNGELQLVARESEPDTLLDTGIRSAELLRGWVSSPVGHVWLILDVCHSGAAGGELSQICSYLNTEACAARPKGKGLHVLSTSRARELAGVMTFARNLGNVFGDFRSNDFDADTGVSLDRLLGDLNVLMPHGQKCQRYGGGDGWPAFLPLAPWQSHQQHQGGGSPTDADLHRDDLDDLVASLEALGRPASWLVRLLPEKCRMQAHRRKFSGVRDLVSWTCGLQLDGPLCPLVTLALRGHMEQDVPEPDWIGEMAGWRGAGLASCRIQAEKEQQEDARHAEDYPARIKVVGSRRTADDGSGNFSDHVDLEIWQDFEDTHGKKIILLFEEEDVHPCKEELGEHLEIYAANCRSLPNFQFTLPFHLLNQPIEFIPVQDGMGKQPLGQVYAVTLTAWERDYHVNFAACRHRRQDLRRDLWNAHNVTRVDISDVTPGIDHAAKLCTGCGPDLGGIITVVNAGLPVLLWTRKPIAIFLAEEEWRDWPRELKSKRESDPDHDQVLIWDDELSGLRHLSNRLPLRVPGRKP